MRAHPVSSFDVCLILKTDAASSAADGGRKRTRMPDSVGHAHLTRAILVASRKGGRTKVRPVQYRCRVSQPMNLVWKPHSLLSFKQASRREHVCRGKHIQSAVRGGR